MVTIELKQNQNTIFWFPLRCWTTQDTLFLLEKKQPYLQNLLVQPIFKINQVNQEEVDIVIYTKI